MTRALAYRLALAGVAAPILTVATYVGLGWGIWSRQPLLFRWLGSERVERLAASYARAMTIVRPGDADRDGVCDGDEFFRHNAPTRPLDHPRFGTRWDTGGFVADARMLSNRIEPIWLMREAVWRSPGERRRVAGWLMLDSYPATFPRGFQLALTPSGRVLLGAAGDPTRPLTLDVSVARDGFFTFDLELPPDAVNDPLTDKVFIDNRATSEPLGELTVRCVWKQPSLAATVQKLPPGHWTPARRKMGMGEHVAWLVEWPPAPGPCENVLLEAARVGAAAEWFPIAMRGAQETSCPVRQFITGPFRLYTGPLKYRVVPIRYVVP